MDGKNIDLHDPSLYINRELSLLDFDFRVLLSYSAARPVNLACAGKDFAAQSGSR